jgi:pimeloyl-ACP methyl ester carboxylesterase
LADQIAAGESLGLGYQLQFREEGFEKNIQGPDKLRHFLRAVSSSLVLASCPLLLMIFLRSQVFEGTTPDGEVGANNTHGLFLDILDKMQVAPYLPTAMEDLFVHEMTSQKDLLVGIFNYYRTAKFNWEDEIEIDTDAWFIEKPSLFICGQRDQYVPCIASAGMEKNFKDIEMHEVDSGHWIQVEAHDEVNQIVKNWLTPNTGCRRV